MTKLSALISLSAMAADCEAKAEMFANRRKAKELIELSEAQPSKSVTYLKELANANASDEIAFYTKAIRIGRAITHAIDGLRSIVSIYKTEMQNTLR